MSDSPEKKYYKTLAGTLIKQFSKRNMDCFYCPDSADAVKKVSDLVKEGSTVSWGGSMTLAGTGIHALLKNGRYNVLDRSEAETPEEASKIYHKALNADYYFMSSNAITMDGKLVNIDGTGNRLAALIYGPEKVIIVAGMNKIVKDEDSALKRIRILASPLNVQRLEKNTPCRKTGVCEHCQSSDCICCQTVITRRSGEKGRITVILVGENLGY